MALNIDLEQLACTGAVQLAREFNPADMDFFFECLRGRNGLPDQVIRIEEIELYHPAIVPVIDFMLDAAGMQPSHLTPIKRAFRDPAKTIDVWHRDQTVGAYPRILKGFSILFSHTDQPGANMLKTASRMGAICPEDQRRSFHYAEGPVVIAQEGFGIGGVQTENTGNTWHTGFRTVKAKFASFDVGY